MPSEVIFEGLKEFIRHQVRETANQMKTLLCALLVISICCPCLGQFVALQGGVGLPSGGFANPPSDEPVERGAKVGFWGEGAYLFQVGPVHVKAALLFLSYGEKEKTFTTQGTIASFRHEFFALTGGVEKQFLRLTAIRPLVFASGGLFLYKTRLVEGNSSSGGGDVAFEDYTFKFLPRFGLRVGTALVYEVVPELVQLRLGFEYTTVLTGEIEGLLGFEAGALKQNYPYPYTAKTIDFWTISLGFVFHPQ